MNVTVRADFGASWYAVQADGGDAAFERARLTYDLDVDVCVIGGGLAGLTAAREIARRGWSVALIEARRVAWGASGRNCGFVLPGFGTDPRAMVERVGIDRARELWQLSEAGVEYVRTTIRDTAMPGVAPVDGWLDVSKIDNGDELLAVASLLGQDFGATIEGWPTEQVRAALKSDSYFHAIHYPTAFNIDPLAYARGLARAALAAGAVIFEETPALAIDPAGVRKRITTPKGRVRAMHIVLAGNADLGALVPGLADTVLPVTGFVAVTAPLGDRLGEAIAYRGAVSDTRLANHHYRIVGGDRLMWSGAGGFWTASPRGAARQFKHAIARVFPQLGEVEVEHAWSGAMGYSLHGMPQVGEVIPGLWLANGFGRHGLNTTAMAGELIATAITEHDDRWRLFLPYELVWAGGRFGRLVRHVGVWSLERGEEWTASVARRREAIRRAEGAVEPAEPQEVHEPMVAEPEPRSGDPNASIADTVGDRPDPGSPLVPEAAVTEADVPEVESLLRRAAERAKGAHQQSDAPHLDPPPRSGALEAESPPFGRNSQDS
jgi:glycine/D-amino acid oxidase-like deaminating enzyme